MAKYAGGGFEHGKAEVRGNPHLDRFSGFFGSGIF
jgi:hypothetical protein